MGFSFRGIALDFAGGTVAQLKFAKSVSIPEIRNALGELGAGDTVIAMLTLALSAGAPVLAAAQIANYAAGQVVRKLGNAMVGRQEREAGVQLLTDVSRPLGLRIGSPEPRFRPVAIALHFSDEFGLPTDIRIEHLLHQVDGPVSIDELPDDA